MQKTPMTQQAASRIQSATAKSQGQVSKGSFAATAQSVAAKNAASAKTVK
jgi:Seed maturation protein